MLENIIMAVIICGCVLVLFITFIQSRRSIRVETVSLPNIPESIHTELAAQKESTAILRAGVQELLQFQHKVLIVDDEADVRHLFNMRLRNHQDQCMLFFASGVKDALMMLRTLKFDLCLVDLKLRDGDGMEVIGYILDHTDETKIICMTAYATTEIVGKLQQLAIPIIEKPLDFQRVHMLMKKFLHGTANIYQHEEGLRT